MTTITTSSLLISIFCPDRTGLISAIAGKLFDLGISFGDTTFSILGTGAEFTAVCEPPANLSQIEIEEQLKALPELANAKISITVFELSTRQEKTADITHYFTIQGEDHPGLIAQLAEVFMKFNANIVRLNAKVVPTAILDQYVIQIAAWIPQERTESCLASINNTASLLQMTCQYEEN